MKQQWCIPPKANAAFVCAMEDILAVYKRPYDPEKPLVCMDETSKQLVKETRSTIAAKPGIPARYDYECERNGVSNLFMFYEPFGGKRYVSITDRRTKIDWALRIKELLDNHYPNARKVVLVMDNLNTHTGLEPHYTRCFHPMKPDACWTDWKYIILPSMAAGSTLLKSNCEL